MNKVWMVISILSFVVSILGLIVSLYILKATLQNNRETYNITQTLESWEIVK
jgi:hypothetical protein